MDITQFFQGLDNLFAGQRISEAEEYLTNGLAQAEAEEDLGAVLSICNELGGFYRVQTRYAQGAVIFEKALTCIRSLGLENTQPHATTLLNYASMLTAAGDVGPALQAFEGAAAILQQTDTELYTLAALHNNISSLYYQLREYDRAMEHANAALENIALLPGSGDEQGVTHTKRAQILARQHKTGEALATLEKAEACFAATPDANPGHWGATLLTMGEVYGDMARWQESALCCQRALEKVAASSGHSLSYASVLHMLSRAQEALGQAEAAAASQREAEEIEAQYSGGKL